MSTPLDKVLATILGIATYVAFFWMVATMFD